METTTPEITTSVYVDPDRTMVTMPHGRYMMHSDDARAVRIACNSHGKLVEACKRALSCIQADEDRLSEEHALSADDITSIDETRKLLRAALAKLEGD